MNTRYLSLILGVSFVSPAMALAEAARVELPPLCEVLATFQAEQTREMYVLEVEHDYAEGRAWAKNFVGENVRRMHRAAVEDLGFAEPGRAGVGKRVLAELNRVYAPVDIFGDPSSEENSYEITRLEFGEKNGRPRMFFTVKSSYPSPGDSVFGSQGLVPRDAHWRQVRIALPEKSSDPLKPEDVEISGWVSRPYFAGAEVRYEQVLFTGTAAEWLDQQLPEGCRELGRKKFEEMKLSDEYYIEGGRIRSGGGAVVIGGSADIGS